jgi:hypothetical protein
MDKLTQVEKAAEKAAGIIREIANTVEQYHRKCNIADIEIQVNREIKEKYDSDNNLIPSYDGTYIATIKINCKGRQ